MNAVDDFCLWGPPATTSNEGDGTSKIGNVEQIVVFLLSARWLRNEAYSSGHDHR